MKFLCDVNISRRTTNLLKQYVEEVKHVNDLFENSNVNDINIIRYADANDYVIISHDKDFFTEYLTFIRPRKLIYLKTKNTPTSQLGFLFKENITDFISILSLNGPIMIVVENLQDWIYYKTPNHGH